jgi:phage shock protein PspC (stress-responsive transcriptional regulator)
MCFSLAFNRIPRFSGANFFVNLNWILSCSFGVCWVLLGGLYEVELDFVRLKFYILNLTSSFLVIIVYCNAWLCFCTDYSGVFLIFINQILYITDYWSFLRVIFYITVNFRVFRLL